ncbi:MAG: DUF72 domain-containing protein, partial [Acidimicrobiia bacterium]
MTVHVGTSGWQYRDWRGSFYPARLAQGRWLEHYAAAFGIVEVNNTFYRLPERSTFEEWAARTPADFVFAMKASRYLTHIKRLGDPAEPVARMLDHAGGLGRKLGPVLLQLPPNLRADLARLADTLARFPERVLVAFEPRHESWFTDDVYKLLEQHNAALCLTDRARRKGPVVRTADWYFLRFHEGLARPRPCYGDGAPALLITLAGAGYLRGLQDTRTTLVIAVAANVFNVLIEVFFVYGLDLGIAGSAWGT